MRRCRTDALALRARAPQTSTRLGATCAGKSGIHRCLFHASNERSQRHMPSACPPCRDRLSGGSVKLSAPNAAGAALVLSSVGQVLLITKPHKGGADGSGRLADPLVPAALPVARRFLLLLPPLPLLSAVVENLSTDEFLLKLACKQIYSLFEGPSSETPVSAETICRYTDLGNTVFFYRTLKFSRERALFALI